MLAELELRRRVGHGGKAAATEEVGEDERDLQLGEVPAQAGARPFLTMSARSTSLRAYTELHHVRLELAVDLAVAVEPSLGLERERIREDLGIVVDVDLHRQLGLEAANVQKSWRRSCRQAGTCPR